MVYRLIWFLAVKRNSVVSMQKKILQKEVKELVWLYWDLMAAHEPVSKFVSLIDQQNFKVALRGTDVEFHGLAGLADLLFGKVIFFDERFAAKFTAIKIHSHQAIAKTKGIWEARTWNFSDAKSQLLRADIEHTWTLEREALTNKLIIKSQICEKFKYQKGYAPIKQAKNEFHFNQE